MDKINNTELNRGRNSYDSKVKNLKGIFAKVKNILNISKYKSEFDQIKKEVNNNSSLSNKMMFQSMQLDYEGFAYGPYIKRLDSLLENVERDLLPFYELHLLSTKIAIQLSTITWENIDEIIRNTKKLIDLINSLNTHNEKDKNALIDEAYKTIYSVIMHEEIFNRSDCLTYINYLNIPTNRENIGRLLTDDLKKLSESEIIDEELRAIKTEGLGYDYLSPDFICKISRKCYDDMLKSKGKYHGSTKKKANVPSSKGTGKRDDTTKSYQRSKVIKSRVKSNTVVGRKNNTTKTYQDLETDADTHILYDLYEIDGDTLDEFDSWWWDHVDDLISYVSIDYNNYYYEASITRLFNMFENYISKKKGNDYLKQKGRVLRKLQKKEMKNKNDSII